MVNSAYEHKFIADVMLGKLAHYLVFAGFDCDYHRHIEDEELSRRARDEDRILLSRDRALIQQHSPPSKSYLIESAKLKLQITNLFEHFNLTVDEDRIFSRCPQCNTSLEEIEKAEIIDQIPRETRQWIDSYLICPDCDKIYWKGSHYEDVVNQFIRWNVLED